VLATLHTTAAPEQLALLQRLDDLTALQERALAEGDILALGGISEQRAAAVRAAAAFVPPAMPWAPEVLARAAEVKERADALQRSIQSCMTAVRKELLALNNRQRVGGYLQNEMAQQSVQWRR